MTHVTSGFAVQTFLLVSVINACLLAIFSNRKIVSRPKGGADKTISRCSVRLVELSHPIYSRNDILYSILFKVRIKIMLMIK